MWIPILICTYEALCSGRPIEGKPEPTYEACQRVLATSVELFRADMIAHGLPELGSTKFTDLFIGRKCEKR